jgi:hypothetical protein
VTAAWLLIVAPFAELAPAVAQDVTGDYYRGDGRGLGVSLSLRPDATYSFKAGGHLGPYADTQGRFSVDASWLTLEPSAALTPEAELMLPTKFKVVPWADRLYLIPEAEGPNFASHVNRREEPRSEMWGWFLLRERDWEKKAHGTPRVPSEWQQWLLRAPIEGRITRALARHRAEIDVGSKRSVSPGLVLTLVSKKYGWTDVRVVSVTAGSSVIENDYGDPPLLVGWRVTSRP